MSREEIAKHMWESCKPANLYMILDTALAGGIVGHLTAYLASRPAAHPSGITCLTLQTASLCEGKDAVDLRSAEPLLISFGSEREFHERMVVNGWGRAWGVFLSSAKPFAEVAAHLSSLLKVLADGQIMYFRYYDPRILRVFLPTCEPAEWRQFFEPVDTFWVEGENPADALQFRRDERRTIILKGCGTVCP